MTVELVDPPAEYPRTAFEWPVVPEAFTDLLLRLKSDYAHRLPPIYITENGTCDNDDRFRCLYLYEHLKALCESGLPVERYYHWCFTDNFEWAEGESARFGLVKVDYETQARTVKRSGYFFRDVIAAGGVTEPIYREYVAGQHYPTNG